MRPLLFAFLLLFAAPALAAPSADLWPRWQAFDPESTEVVDHGPWNRFVTANVVGVQIGASRIGYAHVTSVDRALLEDYVEAMARVRPTTLSRAEQLAYWINLYNALTVKVVLDHYPVESIRDIDISPGLFSSGPWGRKLITIEGEEVSLDDIEHRILRPIWKDPRIHYAVNCASLGCPDLQNRAFTGANAEALLDVAARTFVNSHRAVTIEDGDLVVSSIYEWFEDDFGNVVTHLKRYADETLAQKLAPFDDYDDHAYDWSLNDWRP